VQELKSKNFSSEGKKGGGGGGGGGEENIIKKKKGKDCAVAFGMGRASSDSGSIYLFRGGTFKNITSRSDLQGERHYFRGAVSGGQQPILTKGQRSIRSILVFASKLTERGGVKALMGPSDIG